MATIERFRPRFHFTTPLGWINDPNGLCYFNGLYHLFYQHNPNGTHWEKMHWGHATSSNLLEWIDQPVALYPDQPYEDDINGGCFSGSAIVHKGRLYLLYTASQGGTQRQCLAFSDDGFAFEKYSGNPIIESSIYSDFRDPKVFKQNELFYLVLGAFDSIKQKGVVLLYSSKDLYNWQKEKVLFEVPSSVGEMPECPDFFLIKDKWILTFSPIKYGISGATVVVVIGSMDFESCVFTPNEIHSFDNGGYYYALQTFLDKEGNRIGVGWCGTWPWMYNHKEAIETIGEGWNGYLSMPRTITVENGRLKSFPIHNGFSSIFTKVLSQPNLVFDKEPFSLREYIKDVGHLHFKINISDKHLPPLEIGIYRDHIRSALVICDLNNAILSYLEINTNGSIERNFNLDLALSEPQVILDVYMDRSSFEIFVNRGAASITINTYRAPLFDGPWLRSLGGKFFVEKLIVNRIKDDFKLKILNESQDD